MDGSFENVFNRRQYALNFLKEHPDMLDTLIEFAMFETFRHDCHDEDRPCCKGYNMWGHCDDCYSGDTEFDHRESLKDFSKELCKSLHLSRNIDESDEEGVDDEEKSDE